MTSINTNTDFPNYDKFMEAAKQGQEGLDKIYDYIDTQKLYLRDSRLNKSIKVDEINKLKKENEELKQQISDITDAVWDESFPDVRTDLLIQDIHKLRVDSNELKKLKEVNKTWEDIHNGDMKIAKMLKEKWNEEQAKNKKLKVENTELMKEQYKLLDEKDSLSTTFWTKNEELKEENKKLKSEACLQGAYYSGGPTFRQLYENQNIEFEGQKNKIKYLEKKNEEFEKRADAWNIKINKLMMLINDSNASS